MAKLPFLFDAASHQALSNLSVALDLAKAGIFVFPCKQDKTPLTGVFWRSASSTDEFKIRNWWDRDPDALVAIDCGRSGFLVIDADGALGSAHWDEVRAGRAGGVPTVTTPGGGVHYYFRQATGREHGNGRGSLPAKAEVNGELEGLDVRGRGGYVIAPGSTLSEGDAYDPHDADLLSAPVAPDWLLDILGGARSREDEAPEAAPATAGSVSTGGTGRLLAYGAAALEAECAAVAGCGKGGRNEALNRAAFALGTLVGPGALTAGEIEARLIAAAEACGLLREDGRRACQKTIQSGLRAGTIKPREIPDSGDYELDAQVGAAYAASILASARRVVETPDGTLADAETGEVINGPEEADDDPIGDAFAFGDISRPDGLLGAVTDWIVDTSRKPNRPLAMTAAIALLCGVTSRHIMGPTQSATHLYLVNLAATAVGKDWPFKAIDRILTAAGYGALCQSGKFKSDTAIELAMQATPVAIATVDEIGSAIFAKMANRRASSHESGISSVLRELWSVQPGDTWSTSARAGQAAVRLESPALTILGASTLNEFYKSLTGASIDNGFLNRFTVIMADPASEERDAKLDRRIVPDAIVRGLADLLPRAGNLEAVNALFSDKHPTNIREVPWSSPAVGDMHLDFARRVAHWRDGDETASPFLGRTAEMAVRLATVHAVGRGGRMASITERDYRWGASVALASARFMIEEASLRMAETDYQANLRLVLSFIKDAREIRRKELTRKIDGRWDAAMTDKILRSLAESGQIAVKEGETTAKGGRPPSTLVYVNERRGG